MGGFCSNSTAAAAVYNGLLIDGASSGNNSYFTPTTANLWGSLCIPHSVILADGWHSASPSHAVASGTMTQYAVIAGIVRG